MHEELGAQWLAVLLARCREGLEGSPSVESLQQPDCLGAGPAPPAGSATRTPSSFVDFFTYRKPDGKSSTTVVLVAAALELF